MLPTHLPAGLGVWFTSTATASLPGLHDRFMRGPNTLESSSVPQSTMARPLAVSKLNWQYWFTGRTHHCLESSPSGSDWDSASGAAVPPHLTRPQLETARLLLPSQPHPLHVILLSPNS